MKKVLRACEIARTNRLPVVQLTESCGGRWTRAASWTGGGARGRSIRKRGYPGAGRQGQDVVNALGVERPDTDRLRHVAFLGVRIWSYAYLARGKEPRSESVRIELVLSSGAAWTDADETARNRLRGRAADFCLVVTRRRHVQDTDLVVRGEAATEWMPIARAFAGPAATGREPGPFPKRHGART